MSKEELTLIYTLLALLGSIFSTFLINPQIINFSRKYNLIDIPNNRKQHNNPLTRIGGLSIFLGFSFSIIILWIISLIDNNLIFEFSNITKLSFLSLIFIFFVGLYDDIFDISPFIRLFLQFIISSLLWFSGLQINNLDLSLISNFNVNELPSLISFLFSVIWITGVTNAFNWIDGLDGLASSLSLVGSISMMLVCFSLNNIEIGLIFASIAGANIGFLHHNKYPAKLMMGDGGSYFIGFSYSIYSLKAISGFQTSSNSLSIFIPFFIIIIPLADMTFVIIRRLLKGLSAFYPDRSHLHHRLLNIGLTHENTVKLITFSQILVSTILLTYMEIINIIIPLMFLVFLLLLFNNLKNKKNSIKK